MWVIRQLFARGYWKEAGEEEASGGGAENTTQNTNSKDETPAADAGKPTENEAKLLKEVMARKAKAKELEAEAARLKADLARFDGIDPAQVALLLKGRAEKETADLAAQGAWEKLKERMAAEHAADIKRVNDELAAIKARADGSAEVIHKLTIGHSFDASKFLSETVYTPRKAALIYGSHFAVDAAGSVVAYDKPVGDSDRAVMVDAQGAPLAFDEALKRLVEADPERDEILRSKRKSGSGSTTEVGKPKEKGPALTGKEKIALGLKLQSEKK